MAKTNKGNPVGEGPDTIPTSVVQNRVYENIIRWTYQDISIRVWCAREVTGPLPGHHYRILSSVLHGEKFETSPMAMAIDVTARLRSHGVTVNAAEVMVGDMGCLYYPDWP